MEENSENELSSVESLSVRDQIQCRQNEYCSALGDREWDCFTSDQYRELWKKIAFALFGPPEGMNDDGTDAIYSNRQEEKIQLVYDTITTFGTFDRIPKIIYMSTIFVFGEELKKDGSGQVFQIPVFRIRKCHKKVDDFDHVIQFQYSQSYGYTVFETSSEYCQMFVDDEGRMYRSWENYLKNNRLPKCRMYAPKDGRYQVKIIDFEKKESGADLEICLSPSCSVISKIADTVDIVGTVGGIGSMVVCGAAAVPAITVAPAVLAGAAVVGISTGVYAATRSIFGLHDRRIHKQSIGIKNAESRGHWLNIAGGIASGAAAGTSKILGKAVEKGVTIGMAGRTAFNVATGANLIVNGAGVANSIYMFKVKRDMNEKISNLEIFQFTTNVLFFGHAIWSAKTANTFINETQTNVLTEYENSLISNRKRKMFTKALKEAERIKGRDVGRAEMIRGLRSVENPNELFAVLVRNNKLFNAEGASFTVGPDGRLEVNNVLIESSEFKSMPVTSKRDFLASLPERPSTATNAPDVKSRGLLRGTPNSNLTSRNLLEDSGIFKLSPHDTLRIGIAIGKLITTDSTLSEKIDAILNVFNYSTQMILKDIIFYFYDKIRGNVELIDTIYPNTPTLLIIAQFILQYLQKLLKTNGNSNLAIQDTLPVEPSRYDSINQFLIDQLDHLIRNIDKQCIDEMIMSFHAWIQERINTFWEKYDQIKERMKETIENQCSICGGVYYTLN